MKKNISFAVFATLLSCLPAEAGQPSLCQSGIATRQLCSNLDSIITGELQYISALDKFKNKEIDSGAAITLIIDAQKLIQLQYSDTTTVVLSGDLDQEDMRFARELNPRIVNVYRKCDGWIKQFQATGTVSKVDYDNITNFCKIEPQNLYDTYCKPMDESKCADKGEKAGVTILNDFKRKTGGDLCGKFQEIDSLVQNKVIGNSVCECDDAFNNALTDYINKHLDKIKEDCAGKPVIKELLAEPARIKMPGGEYAGEMRDGKMYGEGVFYYADNSRFEGKFLNDIAEGVLIHSNGEKFTGRLKPMNLDDMSYTKGTGVIYESGHKISGDFNDGKITGDFKFKNGDYFLGKINFLRLKEMVERGMASTASDIVSFFTQIEGTGKLSSDGWSFKGEIKNGKMEGIASSDNGDYIQGVLDIVLLAKEEDFSTSRLFVKLSTKIDTDEIKFEGEIKEGNVRGKLCMNNRCFESLEGKFENKSFTGTAELKEPDGTMRKVQLEKQAVRFIK